MNISTDFLLAIPKPDLHVHLDGSLRLGTLIELAQEYGVSLPSYTEDGLRALVFKERYENLGEYLTGFRYTVAVLQSEAAIERVAYELALDNQAEGVRYIEVRYAPHLHSHSHLDPIQTMRAVNRGLERAARSYNERPGVVAGTEPPFAFGIIVCGLRMFSREYSEYYANLLSAHRFSPPSEVYGWATLELVRAAVEARDRHAVPIVGLDLAGQERGYPPIDHEAAYRFAHRHFLCKTVHAGEAYGPESIFQAITELHADRIGHGYYLMDAGMVSDPQVPNADAYVHALSQYIADRRITLEVCLTSNFQTIPELTELGLHNARKFRDARLSFAICTDNRLISNTSVTKELQLAVAHLGFDLRDIRNAVIYGFKRSFFPGTYAAKRAYVRQIIDHYGAQEELFKTASATTGSEP
ncbi:MAG: adenosine deaminase family protein [Candidatus Schekmanbacteria bacterium]|nr:adenosine deaminase family protein [Candidatus Schekmanbacteria bacterium]